MQAATLRGELRDLHGDERLPPALAALCERWLSLDPDERPSAESLAAELSVLTAPEEARANRRRWAARLLPVLIASGLLVSLLWLQVREQKGQISEQRTALSAGGQS